jgi:hypothetical protein
MINRIGFRMLVKIGKIKNIIAVIEKTKEI